MKRSSNIVKKEVFTYWQVVKKWTLLLYFENTYTSWAKKNFVCGATFEKKQLLTWSDDTFRKYFFASTSNLLLGLKRIKSSRWQFCIFDCVLKRWKNAFGRRIFENIGGKKGLPHCYHWMLTKAWGEFLQCPERVERLRPKYCDHIFCLFISANGLLIRRYFRPQTSNPRYDAFCLRSKLASDLKQE